MKISRIKTLAKQLEGIAAGEIYSHSAIKDAMMLSLAEDEAAMLERYFLGQQTATDHVALQALAIRLRDEAPESIRTDYLRKNLKALIEKADTNPTKLSKATGVPQPTIKRILDGTSAEARSRTVVPIAEYFCVSVEELRNRDLTNDHEALQDLTRRMRNGLPPEWKIQQGSQLLASEINFRQYVALTLRVPNSGTPWLDEMIEQSVLNELAAKAMQGICAGATSVNYTNQRLAADAFDLARAMMAEGEGKSE